jgi:hypothetical protein
MAKITTEEILQMGVQKLRRLPEKEARKYLSQVFSAANKRIKSLSKLKYTPTALKHVQSSGITKFGVKGKANAELWKQYAAAQDLWAQKSGTVKGAKEVQAAIFRIQAMQATMTPEQQQIMWDIYSKIENNEIPGSEVFVKQQFGSDNMQNFIADEVTAGRDADEILQRITNMIEGQEPVNEPDDFWSFGQN